MNNFFTFIRADLPEQVSNRFEGLAQKGFEMKTAESRTVDPVRTTEDFSQPHRTGIDPVNNVSFREIEERVETRTTVLNAILAKQAVHSWRHWGLNE